ncbi:Regulatory protein BlaR1 [Gimesia panareensis]|uniref:Regulatory protein BlaR1 n=2 Tax=Gimesia panareensis TaxID=2527978 RepID=A0A517QEX8_9PLAN|nr:Regulatory protein BlaR1 [Gimesia panareensis]
MSINPEWSYLIWQQVWQCTLLALVVWLICRLVRIRRAHLTYLLWLVVLLKFVTPPLWSSSSGLFCWMQSGLTEEVVQNSAAQQTDSLTRTEWIRRLIGDDVDQLPEAQRASVEVTIHDPQDRSTEAMAAHSRQDIATEAATAASSIRRSPRMSWLTVGLWFWTGMAVLIATVMLIRFLCCWQTIRRAGVVNSPELDELLVRLCGELGLKRRIRLVVTHSRIGPAVIGLFRPTILLPTAIAESRTPEELKPILAHELIHIRRGDLWIGLLQLLASIVWWFHPLVWLTGRRLKFEMEQCCDEEVLAELKCDPRRYAGALLEILELKQTLKTVPMVPGVRPVEITSKRMERIMRLGQGSQKRTPWWCWVVFVTLAAVVLPGAAFVVSAGDEDSERTVTKTVPTEVVHAVKPTAEAQRSSKSEVGSDKPYIRPVPLLSQEIDIPKLVINSSRRHTHSIDDLLARARNVAGVMRANDFLIDQIRLRIAELPEVEAESPGSHYDISTPFYFETLQIPIRDERKQYRIRKMSGVMIKDDQLEVFSANRAYHRRVEQVLAELRQNKFTKLKITTTLVSVSERFLQDHLLKRKSMKVFTRKQSVKKQYLDLRNVIWNEPEQVSYDYLVCDVLDQERSRDFMMKFLSTPEAKVVFVPPVSLECKQSATIASKIGLLKGQDANSLWWNTGEGGYGVSIDLQTRMSDRSGAVRRDMLNYQMTFYQVDGETRLKTDQEVTERPAPLISQQVYKDAMLLKPGETLLAGGFPIASPAREEKRVLLVMLQAERESVEQKPESELLMLGEGVNSDAGVTGHIQLDQSNFKDTLVTECYPVADLVVPIPRHVIVGAKDQQVKAEPPRFDALIELIQQNVTPEAWEKEGPTIRAFEKDLSLVIRAKHSTHDQIAELISRIRAVHDQMIPVDFRIFTTEDVQKWYEYWDHSDSAEQKQFSQKLRGEDLNQGVLISASEAAMIQDLVRQPGLIGLKLYGVKLALFNRQSAGFELSRKFHEGLPGDSRIQFRPVIKSEDQIQLSMMINATQSDDPLSNFKSMTIPMGKKMLVDVTDQLLGQETPLLPYELINQGKTGTRYFMIVSPGKKITMSESFKTPLTPPSR